MEIIDLEEKTQNQNLLGKLLGDGRNLSDNINMIIGIWGLSRQEISVVKLGNNFFLFSFNAVEDFVRTWARGTVFIEKQCLVLRRWHPDISLDDRSMCFAQLWVRLPGIHCPELLSAEMISEIGSELGQIIAIDRSGGEVCMCVELDVNYPLVMEVTVGESRWSLQYELPMLCFNCSRLDHRKEECQAGEGGRECGPHNLAPTKHSRGPVFASLVYVTWRRPRAGWVKLNFDGAVKLKSQRSGAGGLLRDDEGEFMAGFATPVKTSRPLFAEMLALRDGLQLAADSGVEYVWIEGDSRIAIEMLNGWREAEPADEKQLMEECRNLMKTFKEATAKHAFREANQSADHLANLGAEEGVVEQQWRSRLDPPLSLMPFLERDMAGCLVPRLVL